MRSLETEPVGRLLVKYALPAIAGMVVFALYNVVDSIFIGHWVGEYALAGLAVAFPVMNLSVALGTLFGVGGAALCSIRLGEKDAAGAQTALGNVFTLGIAVGVVFGAVSAYFLEPILIAFGASEHTLPYAYRFMMIIQLSVPVSYTFFNMNHMMRASGYPNRALFALTLSVVVNVALAPLFIKVFGWGITGAALATLCAQLSGLVYVLLHFLSKKSNVHFTRGIFRPRAGTVLPTLSIGSAPSILNACACITVVIINYQLLRYGGDLAVGAYGIFARVVMLVAMVVIGLTQGMQPIVGYNHGACRYDRVRAVFRLTLLAGTAITTLGFLVCELFPEAIARAFTSNEELIAFTVRGLRIGPALFALADTPEAMARLRPEDVEKIIRPCGLSPRKSRAIVSLSKDIAEKHGGRVPADFAALEALDGVGHKTASVVMSQAFGVPAFPVDTHIHRLAARWKLSSGKSVERTERDLKALFPRERWNRLHIQMILYGREHCTARGCDGHVCGICRALNGGKKPPRGKAGGGKK